MKRKQASNDQIGDGVLAAIATRLRGVMGDIQQRHDVTLTGSYDADRAACERAIAAALAELEGAHDDFDLAWAWHGLDEAYCRLAHVTSRAALARRREAVAAAEAKKRRAL